jgi:hypothetical protein
VDHEFREWFQQHGFWSDSTERLFLHLTHIQQLPSPITNLQKQLLEEAVADALDNVNIAERYPSLFCDLLNNVALRHQFMEMVRQNKL